MSLLWLGHGVVPVSHLQSEPWIEGYVDVPVESARNFQSIPKMAEKAKARFDAEFAIQVTQAVRAPSSLWAVLTGFSKDRMIAEDDSKGTITLFNTAHYARWLEYGRNSPHRGAARRTINAAMSKMLKASLKEAVDG